MAQNEWESRKKQVHLEEIDISFFQPFLLWHKIWFLDLSLFSLLDPYNIQ